MSYICQFFTTTTQCKLLGCKYSTILSAPVGGRKTPPVQVVQRVNHHVHSGVFVPMAEETHHPQTCSCSQPLHVPSGAFAAVDRRLKQTPQALYAKVGSLGSNYIMLFRLVVYIATCTALSNFLA